MTTGPYEAFIDILQAYLIANVDTSGIGNGGAITWTIGDVGQVTGDALPAGLLIPFFDSPEIYSAGVDMDTMVVPLLVVVDLHEYGPAIANANAAGGFEQPGYRVLLKYGEAIRAALRQGGKGITLGGDIATSMLPVMNFVWLEIGKTPYRGVRLVIQAQQRVPWTST
jgi:hypothetical protein